MFTIMRLYSVSLNTFIRIACRVSAPTTIRIIDLFRMASDALIACTTILLRSNLFDLIQMASNALTAYNPGAFQTLKEC